MGTVVSPKAWIGYLDRSIEITYGNQDIKVTRDPEDVSSVIGTKSLVDDLNSKWIDLNSWANHSSLKFVDQVKKDDKGDPIK